MPAPAPEISVVIPNRDGRNLLEKCLESVAGQEVQGGFDVVLVDNGSSDGSVSMVRQRFPEVRVLEPGRNLGFAAGCNLGIRSTGGPFVVLLNNDAMARPGFLAALRAAALSDERAGAVTAKLLFADRPATIQNAGGLLLSDGGGADRGAGEADAGQYGLREEVFGFCGAAALLRRSALQDCGLFDETFFMYYEDTDLSWRMRLRGWRVVYEPAAVADHVHASSSREWSEFFTFHVDRNRLLMLLKNAPAGMLLKSMLSLARRGSGRDVSSAPGHSLRWSVHVRVLLSLARLAPHCLYERARIRLGRRAPDSAWRAFVRARESQDGRRC